MSLEAAAAADSTEVIDIDVIKETEQPAGKKTYYAYWKIPVDAEVFTVTFDVQTEQVTDAIVVPAEQSLPEGALVVNLKKTPKPRNLHSQVGMIQEAAAPSL